jgi:cation diffusion facilitator CzcD-associated flavoprotein CzcO
MGCKRILLSNDYYPCLNRDNVELIPHGVVEVRGDQVVAADGSARAVDSIIYGTGFDPAGFVHRYSIVGLGERELRDVWRDGIEAYYGIAVSGFPNLFLLAGPNTGLGHNSLVFMIEAQVDYVLQCLQAMKRERLGYLDVRPEVQREHNAELRQRLKDTVWSSGCKSWYLDESGRNYTLWPGYTFEYWMQTRRMNRSAFRGEVTS